MHKRLMCAAAAALLSFAVMDPAARASDIRATPTTLEPLPGSSTASLTMINEEQRPLRVQVRVMKWSQTNGRETYEPTRDVVASPPAATLDPGQHYLVRLIRTAKTPPKGEESYRVFVDEIPDPADIKPGAVNLILRQSIPVFFSAAPKRMSIVDWSLAKDGDRNWLVAKNRGDRRLRLSDVALEGANGPFYQQPGLVGYVLPGATMRFALPAEAKMTAGNPVHLRAISDTGIIEVQLGDMAGA